MLLIESSVGLLQTEKASDFFTNNTVQLFRMEAKTYE